ADGHPGPAGPRGAGRGRGDRAHVRGVPGHGPPGPGRTGLPAAGEPYPRWCHRPHGRLRLAVAVQARTARPGQGSHRRGGDGTDPARIAHRADRGSTCTAIASALGQHPDLAADGGEPALTVVTNAVNIAAQLLI